MNPFHVSHRFLRLLAALTYYIGGVGLTANSVRYLQRGAEGYPGTWWPWLAAAVGVALGLIRGRTLFTRACRRNLRRIYALDEPRPWQFFRPAFFAALVLMIVAGRTLSGLATSGPRVALVVAALELTIAVGLLTGSRVFWTWDPDRGPGRPGDQGPERPVRTAGVASRSWAHVDKAVGLRDP